MKNNGTKDAQAIAREVRAEAKRHEERAKHLRKLARTLTHRPKAGAGR